MQNQLLKVAQTRSFAKTLKKLKQNQRHDLERTILDLIEDPTVGQQKLGDLNGVYVYKFKMNRQLTLLAYELDYASYVLTLLAVGPHENFYRDLKS